MQSALAEAILVPPNAARFGVVVIGPKTTAAAIPQQSLPDYVINRALRSALLPLVNATVGVRAAGWLPAGTRGRLQRWSCGRPQPWPGEP